MSCIPIVLMREQYLLVLPFYASHASVLHFIRKETAAYMQCCIAA